MTFNAMLACGSAVFSAGLALFVLWEHPRAFVHRVFAAGMGVLTLVQFCVVMEVQADSVAEILHWERLGLAVTAFMPGTWLLFSLSFARTNYREVLARWRWMALANFVIPLGLVVFFSPTLATEVSYTEETPVWTIPLGWSGKLFHLHMLLTSVVILSNLERTLRVSTGSIRWQIKFMLLGVGGLFASQIYTSSQVLLFAATTMSSKAAAASAVLIAEALIVVSLIRHRLLNADIPLSRTVIYNSITVFVVGLYLLTVGIFTKIINYFGASDAVPLGTFFVFLAAIGLAVILLSDQLRQRIKRLINRHFYRSLYDYRQAWTTFTQRTTSILEVQELGTAVANMVSETFGVPAVTIWLFDDEAPEHIGLGGSTTFPSTRRPTWGGRQQNALDLCEFMRSQSIPVDFNQIIASKAQHLPWVTSDFLRSARLRYCVSLVAGQQFIGVMTLNDRLTKEPFSLEDYTLLKTLADQAAASLLHRKLSQRLLKAKELEAFQAFSAFFVHDLKNLAAKLSLMVQNLPTHYDNPAFRNDMLQVISKSVAKMNAMCSRLSLLTRKIELQCVDADLHVLVEAALVEVKEGLRVPLIHDLHPVPRLRLDPEQLQKVVLNLVLNANEAVDGHGEIRVTTDWADGWAILVVRDNGHGMSREFIERSLFQPFQTTKSHGLGIGLFQSKLIVEAHQGRIEVDSEEGHGSTFRVLLPASAAEAHHERSA
jgi:putative PEP-CTERM system histidine kinase